MRDDIGELCRVFKGYSRSLDDSSIDTTAASEVQMAVRKLLERISTMMMGCLIPQSLGFRVYQRVLTQKL